MPPITELPAALAAALFAGALLTAPASADVLTPKIELDRPLVLAGEDTPVYVLVRFEIPEATAVDEKNRPRLNLSLVLDRSGSMESKGKLEFLKRASKMVVDSLKPRDRLAIVEYDDRITLMWPSSPMEAPHMVKRLIDQLQPRGRTDLVGGMMRGAGEVAENFHEAAINRVLLLSDGLANTGVTDPREIRRLVRGVKQRGVAISTMGLGLDYNEDLMQDIAENAGGAYYYIEHPNQMASIFRRELLTLFRTVARKADFRFEAAPAVQGVQVFGFDAETSGQVTTVAMEDFYAGETRSLLLRLDMAAAGAGPVRLGTVHFSYFDVAGKSREQSVAELSVDVSQSPDDVRHATNREVAVEVALVEAEQRHEENVRLYQSGQVAAARQGMTELANELKKKNAQLDDVRVGMKVQALEVENAEMAEVAAAPAPAAAMSSYLKRSKQRLYQAQKGQRGLYMLRQGDHGFEVSRLQEALARAGVYHGSADGDFDPEVTDALRAYQKQENLDVDGIAGPEVMRTLGLF